MGIKILLSILEIIGILIGLYILAWIGLGLFYMLAKILEFFTPKK